MFALLAVCNAGVFAIVLDHGVVLG